MNHDASRPAVIPRWRPAAIDVLLALTVVAVGSWWLAASDQDQGFRAPDTLGYVLTGVGSASVLWGRRQPMVALVICGVSATLLAWLDYRVDVLPFVVTGLLFMVGRNLGRRLALTGYGLAAGALLIAAASQPADLPFPELVRSLLIFTVAWALGRLTRSRREALLALVAAAEHQAAMERELAASERDRASLAQVEQRLGIARELHDVLAHSISVIAVQATVGAHLAEADPTAARTALHTIGDVSRSSMQELRQMLTLLRDDSTAESGVAAPYEPPAGLANLEPLVDTYRSAGLPVATRTTGVVRILSASADLCAYRIVQEALTNTLKHAGPSRAVVTLDYRQDELQVQISDDGGTATLSTASGQVGEVGHGLMGMRERTSLLGGRFSAGALPGGGFSVSATIPYEPATANSIAQESLP